jgi:hypothetical protein
MKFFLNILVIVALLPATQFLFLSFLGLYFFLSDPELSMNFFIKIISILLGMSGYYGLILLLKGLHKTNHYKKLVFLLAGVIGFTLFMTFVSPRHLMDYLLDNNLETLIGKFPILVNITFIILISIDLVKLRKRTNNTTNK